jgi:hypothetical protein
MRYVQRFATPREAKEFLVGEIATQALKSGTPLSEVERKMLYFSETAWTLPDMTEVNEAFEREYDQVRYEKKIASIIRQLRAGEHRSNSDADHSWTDAVRTLRNGDHYLLVMIDREGASGRTRGDLARLLLTASAIAGIAATLAIFAAHC